MSPLRVRSVLAGYLLLSSLLPAAARAEWPHDPTVNVPVCVQLEFQQSPVACSDGAGDVVIAWQDRRSLFQFDVYAQRLDATGTARWTAHGVPISTTTHDEAVVRIATDGAGGAIIAWYDYGRGVCVQRVDSAGVTRWTTNGVVLSATGHSPSVSADGFGGAFVAWQDERSGWAVYDIYAQRVSSNGVPQWTANGVPLCTATDDQTNPRVCTDGGGGAVVVWTDLRNGNNDLYAQRITEKGDVDWTANGAALCVETGSQSLAEIVADGSGGTIIAWSDSRGGDYDIYAAHLDDEGHPDWGEDVLCDATGDQTDPCLVSDGAGGAIVAWTDERGGAGNDIYAQRYQSGVVRWAANGVALCTVTGEQLRHSIATDGAGGAIVSWVDLRSGSSDIYAQRVTATGTAQWAAGGLAICTSVGGQDGPALAEDGAGGVVVAFADLRPGDYPDIYAQRVHHFGALGNPEPVIVGVQDVPYDQGGQVVVEWTASWLDADPLFGINSYAVWRQVPTNLVLAALARGARLATADEAAGSLDGTLAAGRRVFLASVRDAQATYWEYVGTTPATGFPGYSYVAPTTCDSTPGANPDTYFMVQARYGSYHYDSAPEQGYSVDDLAPATPAPFTGTYVEGTATLAWGQSAAPDFAEYRLYRGPGADFVPDPGNLVATLAETGYVDDYGTPCWYKLCAVDVHGNASPYAVLLPAGTADVPPVVQIAEAWLAAAPNPARGGCAIRFGLPRTARASLTVFDQQGRRVRTLAAGDEAAGEQVRAWDARDDGGRMLPSGLYFLRLETEGRTLVRRVALTR